MEDDEPGAPLDRAVAVPSGTDVLALARAWFPEAEHIAGSRAGPARRLVGARFGGGVAPARSDGPGLLRMTADAGLRGPLGPSAAGVPLAAGLEDVYLVEASAGDAVLTSWLLAVARRTGGAVVDGRGGVRAPAAAEFVGLTLYAPDAVPAEVALAQARSVAPMMRPVAAPPTETYRLAFDTPYDGTVLVSLTTRTQLPVVLMSLAPEAYGRYAYALTWVPSGPAAEACDTVVGRLARGRIVPLVARLAAALSGVTGGTVVDTGGFVVTPEELRP
ncbi:hypothetical protein GCM10009798_22440 [Nocardioides panacihumi]|uniref:SseB family protein n=1 Tax=Nocardioides panacihumi TaxID=400774 RepID=A0ABN2R217_9ACTN